MHIELLDRYDMSENLHCFSGGEHCGTDYKRKVLNPFIHTLKGNLILDLACGRGEVADYLERKGLKTVRLDISLSALNKNQGEKVRASAIELPFENCSFHGIHFKDALVHIEDKEKLFAEASRILKPGGIFLIASAPNFFSFFTYFLTRNKSREMKKMDIDSTRDFEQKAGELTAVPSVSETMGPPYFRWFPGQIVSLANKNNLKLIRNKKWIPKDSRDWYDLPRSVFIFRKNEKA